MAWHCRGTCFYSAEYFGDYTREELDKYLDIVRSLINRNKKVRQFKWVLEKIIQRYLLEIEMSEKYSSIIRK